MLKHQSAPEDSSCHHGSWFTYPPVEDPRACACSDCILDAFLETESTLPYQSSTFVGSSYGPVGPGLSEIEEMMLSDSTGSFGSFMDTTTFSRANLPLPSTGLPPMYNTTSPLRQPTWSTTLEDYPLYARDSSEWLIPNVALTPNTRPFLAMGYPHEALPIHPTSTFSSNISILGDEIISSPTSIAQDLPLASPPGEVAFTARDSHAFSAPPSFEMPDSPQRALEKSTHASSGSASPITVSMCVFDVQLTRLLGAMWV